MKNETHLKTETYSVCRGFACTVRLADSLTVLNLTEVETTFVAFDGGRACSVAGIDVLLVESAGNIVIGTTSLLRV